MESRYRRVPNSNPVRRFAVAACYFRASFGAKAVPDYGSGLQRQDVEPRNIRFWNQQTDALLWNKSGQGASGLRNN